MKVASFAKRPLSSNALPFQASQDADSLSLQELSLRLGKATGPGSMAIAPNPLADTFVGTPGPDTLTGTAGNDVIQGLAGDDVLDGAGGADQMSGGPDNDIYYVDNAGDVVTELAGEGIDEVRSTLQEYTLPANVENLTGMPTATRLIGNAGDNIIVGLSDSRSRLVGLEGNDTLLGYGDSDFLEGGTGDDIYLVSVSDLVTEFAGEGNDTAYAIGSFTLLSDVSIERLAVYDRTTTFFSRLFGNGLDNLIEGNAGVNEFSGGAGADIMVGFGGNDTYYVENENDQVIELAGGGTERVTTRVSYVLPANVENLFYDTDQVFPNTEAILVGNDLVNDIRGNHRNNFINGEGGADFMRGFDGNDIYIVDNIGDFVEDGGGTSGGMDVIYTFVDYVLGPISAERLSSIDWTTTYALNLTGNLGVQLIEGNAGTNRLDGGAGSDTLVGFGGDDSYIVDNIGDKVIETAGGGYDTIFTTVALKLDPNADIEQLMASDPLGTGSFYLTGNELANRIVGNAGESVLDGRGGADEMVGLGGIDFYVVDQAGDVVVEIAGGGYDTVFAYVDYQLGANADVERLSSVAWASTNALNLTGNGIANLIEGNAGANVLNGGGGDDSLRGFEGADSFAFTTALGAGNVDSIVDFVADDDTIQLDDAVFTGLPLGALAPGAFVVGTAAADADDRIVYDQATGRLFFDADGNGAGAAVQFATLENTPVLTAADFIVI